MERLEGSRGKMINVPIPDAKLEVDETDKTFTITEDCYFKTDQPYTFTLAKAVDHMFVPKEGESLYIAEVERLQDSKVGVLVWQSGSKKVGNGFEIYDPYEEQILGEDIAYVFLSRPDGPSEVMYYFSGVIGKIANSEMVGINNLEANKILNMYAEAHGIKPTVSKVTEAIWKNVSTIVLMMQVMSEVKGLDVTDVELKERINTILKTIGEDPDYDVYRKMAANGYIRYSAEKMEEYLNHIFGD